MANIKIAQLLRSNTKAGREDLAIVVNGFIRAIWTIGVTNLEPDSDNKSIVHFKPLVKGQRIEHAFEAVAEFNAIPDGALCRCGSRMQHHPVTTKCQAKAVLRYITPDEAMERALNAHRKVVGDAILQALEHYHCV